MKKDRIKRFRNRLTRINKEPLSVGSFFVIFILDMFILIIIFIGLYSQSELITKPEEYIPNLYYSIIIEKEWIPENRIDKLQDIILREYRYQPFIENNEYIEMNEKCQELDNIFKQIINNEEILSQFEYRNKLLEIKKLKTEEYNDIKEAYDTILLEKITNSDINETDIKNQYFEINEQLYNINIEIEESNNNIDSFALISTLWNKIETYQSTYSNNLLTEYKEKRFFYPLLVFLFQSIFLIPLFFFIFFWNKRSIMKAKQLQSFISTHLLVVVTIPILWKFLITIIDIFPKTIFKVIIDFLISIKIVALWYYFLIALLIFIAVYIIYLIQKRKHEKPKKTDNAISSRFYLGLCIKCGRKIKSIENDKYCIYCGTNQYKKCNNCNNDTYFISKYCEKCGAQIP